MKLIIAKLGHIDYGEALAIQENLLRLRQLNEIEDTLLLLEHPPTLTLGVRANTMNIITPPEILNKQGVNIYKVNRGGDVTYHGPGQIVGYPIISLKSRDRNIGMFFNKIGEVLLQLLKEEYNIKATRVPQYPGVWVGNDKIAAIGIAFKKWVSMHGFALNVNTDLNHFRWINPCGINDRGITSLEKLLGRALDFAQVNEQVINYFCKVFDYQPVFIDKRALLELIGGTQDAQEKA